MNKNDGSSDRSFVADPLSYFSFHPVLHDWCNKGCSMCYPLCGTVHIKDPLRYFSFQPVLHDWCNKGCSMCYPVCGMVHIKYPLRYFSFQPVLHDWCNKARGMCYPVCGMVHIKPLLLIGKSSPCGSSTFPLSLSEWSFTICLTSYNRK